MKEKYEQMADHINQLIKYGRNKITVAYSDNNGDIGKIVVLTKAEAICCEDGWGLVGYDCTDQICPIATVTGTFLAQLECTYPILHERFPAVSHEEIIRAFEKEYPKNDVQQTPN
jgi:hypothetical protein